MDNGRQCEIRPVDFGSLKALVSVKIGAMEIRGFKVIDDGENKPWVAMPSREIVREGRREYFDIVRFEEKAAKEEFSGWVLREYRKAVEEPEGRKGGRCRK